MSTGLAIFVFCVSLAGTLAATVVFARVLDRLSERLGLSEGLHGILTALGADAPEIATAVAALLTSRSKIGVGVVVGSNVFNLAALLGLSAVVAGHVRIHRHGLLLNGAVALAVSGLATALVLGAVGAVVATVLLLLVFVPYVLLLAMPPRPGLLAAAVREEVEDISTGEHPRQATLPDGVLLPAALAAIVLGSIGMVHAAEDLGRRWGVSDVIVGTLVLAALTSLPNVLTAVRLAIRGRGAATVSEAFNSNSLNVLAGIAIPSLFLALGTANGLITFSVWWLLGMTAACVAFAYASHGLRRGEGGVVIALYVAFAAVIASR